MVSVIIPAGGSGTRMGAAVRKQYLMLAGQPVLARTVKVFMDHPEVDEIVVAVPAGDIQQVTDMLGSLRGAKRLQVVEGGSDRQASVAAALAVLAPNSTTVLVHDAVRPLVAPGVISAVLSAARTGAVSAAHPVQETIKVCVDQKVQETLDRSKLWAMQTPQGFPRELLEHAHATAVSCGDAAPATDDCILVERLGEPVHIVPGNPENIKLTTPADLALAQRLLVGESAMAFPGVGIGYDVHRLVAGRPLYLGGVKIAHETGLLGHSDADVLAHAIMDAVLGAAGLGDIGRHFPDTDPRYAGASSIGLMEQVREILQAAGLRPAGVDAVVIAEKPRLAPHVPAMQTAIAAALGLPEGAVSVKATTTERLGFAGREEGIAAQAVARVELV